MARLLFVLGSAAALHTEISDEHFLSLRSSFLRAPESERLVILNRSLSSVRAMRTSLAQSVKAWKVNATAEAQAKSHMKKPKKPLHRVGPHVDFHSDQSAPPYALEFPAQSECGFSCGWQMYRDLVAISRFITDDTCELREWVDWWANGLADLMIDEGEPLHRAMLRQAQTFTGVGYGAPYTASASARVVSVAESIHGFSAALVLLQQSDRVVQRVIWKARRSFCRLDEHNSFFVCPTRSEFVGYTLMIECIITAFLMSGDIGMDPDRRNSTPGELINGFYLAAMTASSTGYGDFAPYSAAAAYLSPVWMAILTGTFNSWAAGAPQISEPNDEDCDSMLGDSNERARKLHEESMWTSLERADGGGASPFCIENPSDKSCFSEAEWCDKHPYDKNCLPEAQWDLEQRDEWTSPRCMEHPEYADCK